MEQRTNGLSRELIIHPGETLKEMLDDRDMSQRELANRIALTEPYISNIINGQKPITISFAKKLEYALAVEAGFWINLQSNYEKELIDYEELNSITLEEIDIVKKLKEIIIYMKESGFISEENNRSLLVIELRRILNVSNLINIPKVYNNGAYRLAQGDTLDPYVLFTWLKVCDLIAEKNNTLKKTLDIEKLKKKIPEIRNLISRDYEVLKNMLKNIFNDCGIKFAIVKNFKGAPVQGVINRKSGNTLNLILTNRGKYADIFWFTLFHEIGHIINKDFEKSLIDYENIHNDLEDKANQFAESSLINPDKYEQFLKEEDYSINKIHEFSKLNKIPPFILIGRLQREKRISYNLYGNEKIKYNLI